jgi:hypothetical protein
MLLGEVNGSQLRQPHPEMDAPDGEPAGSESRALVALDPSQDHSGQATAPRYAPFVAHLVATKDQHPQTRERRRADPSDALAAYRTVAALTA